MMPTAEQYLKKAASYIGTEGDHNIFNKWYWVDYTKTYDHDPGTAWCACFQSYVAMKCGLKCNYSASAAGFATQFDRIPVEKEHTVKPGDIVIFNWDGRTSTGWADHVGVVEWSTIGDNGLFGTIEGNTGNKSEGQVLRVTRNNWSSYFTAFYRPKYSAAKESSSDEKQDAPSKKATKLYGIDVSSNQPESITSDVSYDFAIVKMTGNPQSYSWNFVNPYAKKQADAAYKKTGCVGLYHFTWGKPAIDEAKLFVSNVKKLGYLGKAMLVIDYEAEAIGLGRSWVKELADAIKKLAGYSPVIYASGSVIVAQDLFSLGYPIWCANYYKGYQEIDGYDTSGMSIYPGCEKAILWQYTSQGYLNGYGGPLDCNVFFGSKKDWTKYTGSSSAGDKSSDADIPDKKQPNPPSSKSITTLAEEVIAGKWGNGSDRKKKLEAAGYSYDKVQAKVNELLGSKSGKKSIDAVAKEVIAGKWGNGSDRKKKLEAAGYSYDKVQAKVNELLNSKNIDKIAQEVIAGKWGNGQHRVNALRKAGYDAAKVQDRVNELLS